MQIYFHKFIEGKCFSDIVIHNVRGNVWLLPLALIVLSVLFSQTAFSLRWNAAPSVTQTMQKQGKLAKASEREIAEAIETAQRVKLVSSVASAVFIWPIWLVLGAFYVKLMLWFAGQTVRFKTSLSALVTSLLPMALFHFVLALAIFRQNEVSETQLRSLLPSHLGFWIRSTSWGLNRLVQSIDVFRLASAAILGLALAEITKWTKLRATAWAFFLYVVFVSLVELGLPGLFRGGS